MRPMSVQGGPGILQSFRAPGPRGPMAHNRAVSLSNLLDVGIEDLDDLASQSDKQVGGPCPVLMEEG